MDEFAVFILTHGRPQNVITYSTLRRQGYTGDIYIIVDNEDQSIGKYQEIYGDKVIVFDKSAIAKVFDQGDNFTNHRGVVYARNASFQIARDLGLTHFMQLDDDYKCFDYRINDQLEYPRPGDHWVVKDRLGKLFELYLEYFKSIDAKSIAMAQGGDWIGGVADFGFGKRKCMNTFFCSVDRPFPFVGRINEDVSTPVWYQGLGHLFLTVPFVSVTQTTTQQSPGGQTDLYLDDGGTYVKSFYSVMYAPSCITVAMMGQRYRRLHHRVQWFDAVPCILGEKWRKHD